MPDEIEIAASLAEAETGVRSTVAKLPACITPAKKNVKARKWTEEENAYVRENYVRLHLQDMAAHLGRTQCSVLLHIKREMHLPAPSKDERILVAEQVGLGIGRDVHSIVRLMERGLMPFRRLPTRDCTIRVIDRGVFMRWLLDPNNWCYFKPYEVAAMKLNGRKGIPDCYDFQFWEKARELVTERFSKWKDQWLTPMEVARILNISHGSRIVNKAIHVGNLKATRWGNWWIRRSDLPAPGKTFNAKGRIVNAGDVNKRGLWKRMSYSELRKHGIRIREKLLKSYWAEHEGKRITPKLSTANQALKQATNWLGDRGIGTPISAKAEKPTKDLSREGLSREVIADVGDVKFGRRVGPMSHPEPAAQPCLGSHGHRPEAATAQSGRKFVAAPYQQPGDSHAHSAAAAQEKASGPNRKEEREDQARDGARL